MQKTKHCIPEGATLDMNVPPCAQPKPQQMWFSCTLTPPYVKSSSSPSNGKHLPSSVFLGRPSSLYKNQSPIPKKKGLLGRDAAWEAFTTAWKASEQVQGTSDANSCRPLMHRTTSSSSSKSRWVRCQHLIGKLLEQHVGSPFNIWLQNHL